MDKTLNLIALVLVLVGGISWGLVGLFNLDVVAYVFGAATMVTRVVYVLVGIAAVLLLPKVSQK